MSLVLDQPSEAGPSAAPPADIGPLLRLLDTLRRQTRRWIWVESLALVCLCGAAVFWGSLVLDRAIEPPAWVRASLAAAVLAGLGWLLFTKLFVRLARPLEDGPLALVVERGHGGFRDSLSTAIELAGRPREGVDRQLLSRTIAEAVAMLGSVRPATLFRRRRLCTLALAGAAAAASIAGLALARPPVADLWVRRMVLLGDQPWPRRVSLDVEGFPGGVRKAARGGDVDVVVRATAGPAAGGSGWVPSVVDLRSRGSGGWKTERMGTRGGLTDEGQAFGHTLKAVNEDLVLEVRGGDARVRNLRLVVVDAPDVAAVEIAYTLPSYLGGGRRQAPASRIVQVPRGSDVEIVCRSTKPLSAATMRAITAGGNRPAAGATEGVAAADDAGELLASLAAAADGRPETSIVGVVPALDGDRTIVVRLTDTDGLVNREPIAFVLSAVPDEPPRVAVRMRGISNAVTAKARIPLEGSITDDHGLERADVLLRVANRPEAVVPIARLRAGAAAVDLPGAAPEIVAIEPLGLQPGASLGVAVAAKDACTLDGGPNAGTSDVWSLEVVTPEALLATLEAREIILRRRFESCIADFAQARDRFQAGGAGGDDELPVASSRLGESASRAAGETGEIAAAFRDIRMELDNNLLLTPELDARLIAQIADPLAGIAATDLPAVGAACRKQAERATAGGGAAARADLVRRADEVLVRMRAVLDRMMELESFNEVVELLRGVIRTQEEIRAETLERQRKRAREALEQP